MSKNDKSKYSSIQIRVDLKTDFMRYCNEYGYKVSGLLEKLIQTHLSGSKENSK
jgi:hypothetical protein